MDPIFVKLQNAAHTTDASRYKVNPHQRSIQAMYLITVLNFIAMSLFSPLVNRQVGDLEVPSFTMGLVGSFYGLAALISSPYIGRSCDRFGSRVVFIVSLIATALNNFVQGSSRSLVPFIVARGLAGFFKHTPTLGKIVITELVTRQDIPQTFGYYNAFAHIGVIIGPTIGGCLIQFRNGFHLICLLAGLLYVTQISLFSKYVMGKKPLEQSELNQSTKTQEAKGSGSQKELPTRQLVWCISTQFFFYFAISSVRTNLPINLQAKYGTSISTISYLNSLQSLVGTLIGFTIGPVINHVYKGNNRRMVIHAGTLEVAGLLCYYGSSSFGFGALALLLVEITNSFLLISTVAFALENGGRTSSILGLGRMSSALALMIAPTASGGVQSSFLSYGGPPLLSATMAGLGIVVAIFSSGLHQQKYKTA